jgi:hypothetical protein
MKRDLAPRGQAQGAPGQKSQKVKKKGRKNQTMKNRNIIFAAILFVLVCFALSPAAHAVVPVPDGAYPNFTTAEGQNAL